MIRQPIRSLRPWLAPAALWLAGQSSVHAQDIFSGWGAESSGCATCLTPLSCQTHHCPPPLSHCQEGPPIIRVKCGCPKPICNPCNQPGWGYYETCWSPWPWPPNYNHCLTLPPAATIALGGPNNPANYPYNGPGGPGGPPQQPLRSLPSQIAPSMPPVTAPPVPTTPIMPRLVPNQGMMPQNFQPNPNNGIDSLPFPRTDFPPRPLPIPGGAY